MCLHHAREAPLETKEVDPFLGPVAITGGMAPEKRPDAQQRVPRPADRRMTEWPVKS